MDNLNNEAQLLTRNSSPELDAILGKTFKVLDDGFVRVIDYMGNDASIVQAARVSYGAGTKQVSQDKALIRYLLRHRHTTPFEMCEIKFHVRVPMDIWRQWVRHRTASINEYSTRYSLAIDATRSTAPTEWRMQSTTNRQGSGDFFPEDIGTALSEEEASFHNAAKDLYLKRIEQGVAREQARKDLPLATYTEAYWKCNLHNLLHFLSLRMEGAAQSEIRDYATVIGEEIVSKWVPHTWGAFIDYRMEAAYLSRHEKELLGMIARGEIENARKYAYDNALVTIDKETGKDKLSREIKEFNDKLTSMKMESPWA